MGFLPNLTTTTLLAACVICNFGKCSVYGYLISLSRTITISQEKVRCWCNYQFYPELDGVILVRLPGIGSPPAAYKLNQYLNDQALTAYNTFLLGDFGSELMMAWPVAMLKMLPPALLPSLFFGLWAPLLLPTHVRQPQANIPLFRSNSSASGSCCRKQLDVFS